MTTQQPARPRALAAARYRIPAVLAVAVVVQVATWWPDRAFAVLRLLDVAL